MLGSESLVGALWLIAALGAAVFGAASPAAGRLAWVALPAGFVAGAAAAWRVRLPEPGELAVLVALVAAWELLRPGRGAVLPLTAGLLAGVLSRLLVLQGLPPAAAVSVAAALPAGVAALAARRAAFAPAGVREDALAALFALTIVAAVAPDVLAGWRAAGALNIDEPALDALAVPVWAALVGLLALASGGAWALWSRR